MPVGAHSQPNIANSSRSSCKYWQEYIVELDLTFDADYYCNMHATYLTQKSPQANISRFQASYSQGLHSSLKIGIIIPTPRLLWNRGFWGGANNPRWTHANLSIPCLLASPQSPATMGRLAVEPQNRNQTLSTQSCEKVGLLGRG